MKYSMQSFVIILSLLTVLSACQDYGSDKKDLRQDIKNTAQDYAKSMAAKNFSEAEKYTKSPFSEDENQVSDEIKTRIAKQFSNFSVDTVTITATGIYKKDGEEHHINFEYTNEGWKVIPDEDMFQKGPQVTAKKFLTALNKQDFAKAKEYGTDNTIQILTMLESMAGLVPDGEDFDMGADTETIEWGEIETNGNEAVVNYTLEGSQEKLILVKKDDKWKVDMKKEM
jgi:hypothetical protein